MAVANALVFTICDSANVRDGLLSVLAAGINQLRREDFPTELGSFIAIQIQIEYMAENEGLLLEVEVTGLDGTITGISSFSSVLTDEMYSTTSFSFPFIVPFSLDARSLVIPEAGVFRMALKLNKEEISHLIFSASLFEADLNTEEL